ACVCMAWFVRFFFQAESGIRAATVTGVQPCALPICRLGPVAHPGLLEELRRFREEAGMSYRTEPAGVVEGALGEGLLNLPRDYRSEERRVGKGCRWQGGRGP